MDLLLYFDDIIRILDEFIGELADVHQAILVYADVDEGAKIGDIGDDSRHFHARLQVVYFVDLVGKGEGLEAIARIAPGPSDFGDDIP